MRYDIFTVVPNGQGDYGSARKCYVQAVTKANMHRIVRALACDGETVEVFTHNMRGVGKQVLRLTVQASAALVSP